MFLSNKRFFLSLSVLLGTTIGAGIFGLPYVIDRSGIIPGFFYLLILGAAVTLIHLFFGEIILRTNEKYRLPGFAKKYLGKPGEILAVFSVLFGVVGSLLAYIILGGDFLKILFSAVFPSIGSPSSFWFVFIFWLVLSYFIWRGLKIIAPAEIFTNVLFFAAIFLILWFGLPQLDFSNFAFLSSANVLLPYGVILFSLVGWSALPEINDLLKSSAEKKEIKKIIILSAIIVIAFYLCFSFILIGISGKNISPDLFSGLLSVLGQKLVLLGVLAGVITLADSFLVLGLYLMNTFIHDLKFPGEMSFLIATGFPFLLYLLGLRSFINIIGFIGAFVGVIEGIIIILIFKKAKTLGDRLPEYSLKIPGWLLYFLMIIFVLGAISQLPLWNS